MDPIFLGRGSEKCCARSRARTAREAASSPASVQVVEVLEPPPYLYGQTHRRMMVFVAFVAFV